MSLTLNDAAAWEQHLTAYGMCLLLAEARIPTTALPRKKRLVTAAAVRALWHHLTLPIGRRAVEAGERFADNPGWPEIGRYHLAVRRAAQRIDRAVRGGKRRPAAPSPRAELARVAARVATPTDLDPDEGAYIPEWIDILHTLNGVWQALGAGSEEEAEAHHAGLIRDVFPNPFRPVTFSPSWRTDVVLALAGQMYESRDFGAMPILADALQDAECDSDDILDHCRGHGPHHGQRVFFLPGFPGVRAAAAGKNALEIEGATTVSLGKQAN